jgi:hypothetical protein
VKVQAHEHFADNNKALMALAHYGFRNQDVWFNFVVMNMKHVIPLLHKNKTGMALNALWHWH